MAYFCYKPKGSCVNCEHFRFDEDKQRNCCWAAYDDKHGVENEELKIRKINKKIINIKEGF